MSAPARHVVFLQGMPSPFFRRIGDVLRTRGWRVSGINLCVGDWIFWHGPGTVHYRGTLQNWPDFFSRFLDQNAVTDLVLLGEQRRYHQSAVALAKARGVRVTVTDFGYLRPDWITLERDGMSGASNFPRTADAIFEMAGSAPAADFTARYTDGFWNMAVRDLFYSLCNVFIFYLYPFYQRSDHRAHPLIYFPAMGLRLLGEASRMRRAQARWAAFRATRPRYFVFPLQLTHDFQIVAYSPFGDLGGAIEFVLRSFATHAPQDASLVIKVHPWDPGLTDWEARVDRLADSLGVAGRVGYFDGGNLDEMVAGSAGMVTVNSTSGIRALQLDCPVKVLGKAIYDVAGLSFQGNLDQFWEQATVPDPALRNAFIQALSASIQIRGVFFSEPGLSAAAQEAAERIDSGTVGPPSLSPIFRPAGDGQISPLARAAGEGRGRGRSPCT